MIKPSDPENRPAPQGKSATLSPRVSRQPLDLRTETRMERLVALVDHCTAAKDEADALGETFLSYLIAMTIQEGRAAMRRVGMSKP